MKKQMKVTDMRVFNTTYEDGSRWVEFELEKNVLSYELIEQDGSVPVCSIEDKLNLTDVSNTFAKILLDLRDSENEMWFIEEGELSKEEIKKIASDVEKYKLSDYVEFDNDAAITFYGGLITKFIYDVKTLLGKAI